MSICSQVIAMAVRVTKRHCLLVSALIVFMTALIVVPQFWCSDTIQHTPGYAHSTTLASPSELATVQESVRQCFNQSNIGVGSSGLLDQALDNAQQFMNEYRRVIPQQSLRNHSSHCWSASYSASSMLSRRVAGHIGGQLFDRCLDFEFYGENQYFDINLNFMGSLSSETLCLPKTFLLGFEKCGSTYFWCFISKIVSAYRGMEISSDEYQINKEPYFWTPFRYTKSPPDASTIGHPYMLNYLRSVAPEVSREERERILLIDGTPGTVIEWPRFSGEESDLANYCLLPSTLPQLLPGSKYIVIMREPVSMLYSNYWWSYYFGLEISPSYVHDYFMFKKGPQIFHDNSVIKINSFLDCLREESQSPCPFFDASDEHYSECVLSRKHLHSKCVHEITSKRTRHESAIHRGIYYVHVQKWLSVLPRERILFTTLEALKKEPAKVATQVLDFFEVNIKHKKEPLTDEKVNKIASSCPKNPRFIDYKKYPETKNPLLKTKDMLKKFFAPFNRLLATLLNNEQFLWKL